MELAAGVLGDLPALLVDRESRVGPSSAGPK